MPLYVGVNGVVKEAKELTMAGGGGAEKSQKWLYLRKWGDKTVLFS